MDLEVQNVSKEELREASKKDLRECLQQSVIPEDFWPEIIDWLDKTGYKKIYLDGNDQIGAWWADRETKIMGFELNFTKSEFLPNTWYPEGNSWKEAQANAKLKLVECWTSLLDSGALKIKSED